MSETDLDAQKKAARREAKARRAICAQEAVGAGAALAKHFLAAVSLETVVGVSVFWPLGDEIDTRPLMTALDARGLAVALPVMQGAGLPLLFRRWRPGDDLVPAGFGTQEPSADRPEVVPSLLVVPLLAFDPAGYRLGYGGGFYDRTLAGLRRIDETVRAVGIAYAGQEVVAVPRGRFDQPLDLLVTEEGPRFFVSGREAAQ